MKMSRKGELIKQTTGNSVAASVGYSWRPCSSTSGFRRDRDDTAHTQLDLFQI